MLNHDAATTVDEEIEVEAEAPVQEATPRWEFRGRQAARWGTVTRDGLVVGRGANKKVVPPDEVYKLACLGCTQKEIATWFAVAEETIKYNFHEYIARGKEDMKIRLRQAMFKNAISGNAALQIFLAKNMLGMSDNPVNTDVDRILPWLD
jgi:hypothetical protein